MHGRTAATIPVDGGAVQAVVARPEGSGPHPAVLVIHDIQGPTPDLDRILDRFAAAGYVAVGPDLYAGRRKPMCIVRTMAALNAGAGPAFDVLDATHTWLATQPDVDADQIGTVGFCLGGGFAILHAIGASLAFVGAFYGDVPKAVEDLEGLPPCFGGFGERDLVFRSQGRRLASHLDTLGIANDIRFYDGVGHAYMNQISGVAAQIARFSPMRAAYDEAAAEDSWSGMLEFFADHLELGGDA